ncbi:MAG: F0F1 ATP synthase subunit delta [Candidatus Babeliales bacterium]|jgi:ATP synthase F1 delta subunit
MLLRRQILARKYAQAFINLNRDKLSPRSFSHLQALKDFCKLNKKFFIFLSISSIPYESKKKALDRMAKALKIEPFTQRLLDALLKKRRIHLLNIIIRDIVELYKDLAHITSFKVFTSHELEDVQKKKIINFIQTAATPNTTINTTFNIDRSLISGIRIKSKTLYWEYSLAQQLSVLKKNLYQRVGL